MNIFIYTVKKNRPLTLLLLFTVPLQLPAITSNMTHRVMGSSQLLYKMIDYSKQQTCFEAAPIFSSMYDQVHTNSNMILKGKSSLQLDQQGTGDINPTWLSLVSNNTLANYNSTITFTPKLTQSGALFHWYDQYGQIFFDAKTALVQCKSEIKINEVGGGNGLNEGILNAQQAFTQTDWNYGKIGQANHVVGLDNIELRVGHVTHCTSEHSSYNMLIAGFGILEAPTGSGTKAEWLFEPQVGTNHWGVGFGFEALVSGDDDLKFMIAGNYRYLTPAWETRSFDLLTNGQWSRYLLVQDTYGLPTAPATNGLPGINFFTQQAYIQGRSEINLYTRLQKHFQSCYFEVAYNFFCIQQETIGSIKNLPSGYGIYTLTGPAGGAGGVTTSSTATINQDTTYADNIAYPITITTDMFDKRSAAVSTYATNTLTARLEIHNKNQIYGFGASIEAAQSASAISTWSVWAQFGLLFDNIIEQDTHYHEDFDNQLYQIDPITGTITHHTIETNAAGFPTDMIIAMEGNFIQKENFNFTSSEELDINQLTLDDNESTFDTDYINDQMDDAWPNEEFDNQVDENNNLANETTDNPIIMDEAGFQDNMINAMGNPLQHTTIAEKDSELMQDEVQPNKVDNNDIVPCDTHNIATTEKVESLADDTDNNKQITPSENQTIHIDMLEALPQAENGLKLQNSSEKENQKELLTILPVPVPAPTLTPVIEVAAAPEPVVQITPAPMATSTPAPALTPVTELVPAPTLAPVGPVTPAPMPAPTPAPALTPITELAPAPAPVHRPMNEEEILNKLDSTK